jgi:hypothetical protein
MKQAVEYNSSPVVSLAACGTQSGWIFAFRALKNKACFIHILLLMIIITKAGAQQNKIVLVFENRVGERLLQNDSTCQNAFGEVFTVRNFKYYISNIELRDGNKSQLFRDKYFLIDNADAASKEIQLVTTLHRVTTVKFLLGVDSLKNVSGVQSGVLDPAKGMFWTWNTGYVMAKLEGNSPNANTPQHAFGYHVGGYKPNEKTAREITLSLANTVDCTHKDCAIKIAADILKWFDAVHEIKIATTPLCHEPGVLAMQLADNYSKMFVVEEVK